VHIDLRTEDGVCPAHVSSGAGPGVLLFMDGSGMRPAERHFQVLLDLFARTL